MVVQFVNLHLRTVIYIYIRGIINCIFNGICQNICAIDGNVS